MIKYRSVNTLTDLNDFDCTGTAMRVVSPTRETNVPQLVEYSWVAGLFWFRWQFTVYDHQDHVAIIRRLVRVRHIPGEQLLQQCQIVFDITRSLNDHEPR